MIVKLDECLTSEPIVNVVIKYRPLGLTCWILDY